MIEARRSRFDIYEEEWRINRVRLEQDHPFSPEEAQRMRELLDQQNRFYEYVLDSS